MKKLLVMILALMMAIPAMACDVLPKEEVSAPYRLTGEVLLALEADTRELLGYHDYKAVLKVYPVSQGKVVRGIVDDGVLHIKGCARIIVSGCQVLGLTRIDDIWFDVYPEYWNLVAGIVYQRTGEDLTTEAAPMAAAMQYKAGDRLWQIFFTKEQAKQAVGVMYCNGGKDVAVVYAGLYDDDDQLELGLVDGSGIPAPKKEPEKKCQTVKVVTRTVTEEKGIDITIRIGAFVRSCVTTCVQIFKMCCGKK